MNLDRHAYESLFFFERLEYTKITQIAKTDRIEFISNIGGNLSLFVGISFVSFFEIIEIIIEVLIILFQKNKFTRSNLSGEIDIQFKSIEIQYFHLQKLEIEIQNQKELLQLINDKLKIKDYDFNQPNTKASTISNFL